MNKNDARKQLVIVEGEVTKLRAIIDAPEKITDRVKTFADVCDVLGLNPLRVLPYPDPQNNDELAANYFIKISLIARALNEGWKPNWDNHSEYKYYPWATMTGTSAGSGFSFSVCVISCSSTGVGSRLCFKSSELALYAIKQFEKEYFEYFTII